MSHCEHCYCQPELESVPATYDEQDPMVRRHAAALNAIPAALAWTEGK